MIYTIDWDGAATLTREKVIPRIKDQYFKKNVLMYRLRPKAEMYTGGTFIRQPLSFAPEGGGGQWFAGTDKFDIRVRNPFTSATFQSKNFELPIVITQDEEDTVDGPEAFITLLNAKMKVAERTVMDSIGGPTGIYNAGTNPKAITGLQYAIPDYTGGAPGVYDTTKPYGGIPQTTGANTWWNSRGNNTVFITGPSGGSANYVQANNMIPWDNMLADQALNAGKHASMILCNWGVFNELSAMVNSKTTWFRPQQDTDLAKHGFKNFVYRDVTVVVDEQVPRVSSDSNRPEKVYFIDESAMHLWVHTRRDFAFEGWRKALDQALRVAYIWFRGELTFDERRSSGVHSIVRTAATSP